MDLVFDEPSPELEPAAQPLPPSAPVAIRAARARLNAPPRTPSIWPLIAAAAFAATTALSLATAIIIGLPKF